MPIYAFEGRRPTIDPTAYVAPDAVLIGEVVLGAHSSVWPGAVLRADHGRILIGARTSIQDGSVLHTTPDWPTTVGEGCVVGHRVHLEGCVIEDGCLIGSGSVVLNRAVVRTGSVVGAQALVTEGMEVPAEHLALGVPAKLRPATGQQEFVALGAQAYVETALAHAHSLERIADGHTPAPPQA